MVRLHPRPPRRARDTSMLTHIDTITRLLFTTLLAGTIGLEREYYEKPAGLRTNIMVGIGSALITIASIKAAETYTGIYPVDPTRIAAQIVTGIGFIGAGVILRPNDSRGTVTGLTTAATLWVVCGLGISVGLGLFLEATITTVLVLFTFLVLSKVVKKVRHIRPRHQPGDEHHAG